MDALRIILLIIGIAVIAAIYFFTRRSGDIQQPTLSQQLHQPRRFSWAGLKHSLFGFTRRSNMPWRTNSDASPRQYPPVESETKQVEVEPETDQMFDNEELEKLGAVVASRSDKAPDIEDLGPISAISTMAHESLIGDPLVVVLYVLAKRGNHFAGEDVLAGVEKAGMAFGEMRIFHRFAREDGKDNEAICSLANIHEPGCFDLNAMTTFSTPGLAIFMRLPGPIDGREAFDRTLEVGRTLAEYLQGELCDDSRSILTLQTISHLKEKVESFIFTQQMAQLRKRRLEPQT